MHHCRKIWHEILCMDTRGWYSHARAEGRRYRCINKKLVVATFRKLNLTKLKVIDLHTLFLLVQKYLR